MRSFKTSTNLAAGLTKERVTIQNELQKIGQTKTLLEEMRVASKSKKAEPILTAEEKASKVNKAEIKGTGFQMRMVSSLKGADMIEAQRDSRRQRHIACLQECEKFTDQFYDNFSEKKNEIKERIKVFRERSDVEVEHLMSGLSDELLLANEIGYVNGVWEKVNQQRGQRKEEVQALRTGLDDLKAFQEKGSGSYLGGMRQKLVDIAFFLAPQVDELMKQQVTDENAKYAAEHEECDAFYSDIVE
jgi:gas vesicle protein